MRLTSRFSRAFALIPVLALVTALGGCDSGPSFVLDSDVPQVPGMEQRLGFDIKRSEGDLVGGVFVFVGPLRDTEDTIKKLTSRFRDSGWTVERETPGFPRAALVFQKNDRTVQVVLDADQLEPAMSRAQYVISEESETASQSDTDTSTSG